MNQGVSGEINDISGAKDIMTISDKIHWHYYGVKPEQVERRVISICQQQAFQNTAFA